MEEQDTNDLNYETVRVRTLTQIKQQEEERQEKAKRRQTNCESIGEAHTFVKMGCFRPDIYPSVGFIQAMTCQQCGFSTELDLAKLDNQSHKTKTGQDQAMKVSDPVVYTIDGRYFVRDVLHICCPTDQDYQTQYQHKHRISLDAIYDMICGGYGVFIERKQERMPTRIVVNHSNHLLGRERQVLEDASRTESDWLAITMNLNGCK